MKLIATRPFRNVASLGLKEERDGKMVSTIEGSQHDDHVHKGAIFSIGPENLTLNGSDTENGKVVSHLQKLNKVNPQAAYNISLLVHAGCIADATDKKAVEKVKLSIEEDASRESNAKKLDARQAEVVGGKK